MKTGKLYNSLKDEMTMREVLELTVNEQTDGEVTIEVTE